MFWYCALKNIKSTSKIIGAGQIWTNLGFRNVELEICQSRMSFTGLFMHHFLNIHTVLLPCSIILVSLFIMSYPFAISL